MPTNLPTDHVVADMERIFKPLAGRALVTAFQDDADASHRRGRVGRSWRLATLTGAALTFLIASALAIAYGRFGMFSARSSRLPIVASLQSDAAPPSASPSFLRASSVSTTPVPAAVVPIAAKHLRSSTDKAFPIRAQKPGITTLTATPSRVPRSLAGTKASMTNRSASSVTAGAVALTAPLHRESAEPPLTSLSCEPGSLEDRCIYKEVLNADARLRVAFNQAKQAGVANSSLSAAIRLWRQARKIAEDDPDTTIAQYAQIADALNRQHREVVK